MLLSAFRITSRGLKTQKHGIKLCRTFATHAKRSSQEEEDIVKENWKRRVELATAYRAFEKYNMHEGVCNHLTAKAPSLHQSDPIILIIPYGLYWADVTPECLVGINIDTSEMVEGVELPDITAHSIHRGIYRHRPDVNSVMHTHARYATALSTLQDPEIKMVHQNSARFAKNVAYDIEYDGIAFDGANDESERLGQAIGDKDVLLMGNHGFATAGKTVAEAFDLHYYFEKAAEVQMLAYMTQKPIRLLSPNAVESVLKVIGDNCSFYAQGHLDGMTKTLMKEDPNFIKK